PCTIDDSRVRRVDEPRSGVHDLRVFLCSQPSVLALRSVGPGARRRTVQADPAGDQLYDRPSDVARIVGDDEVLFRYPASGREGEGFGDRRGLLHPDEPEVDRGRIVRDPLQSALPPVTILADDRAPDRRHDTDRFVRTALDAD